MGDLIANPLEVTFPIAETVKKVDIEKQRYVLTLKGNDVVNINPPGKFCPFYQGDFYRDNVTRRKKATRFVSNHDIYW